MRGAEGGQENDSMAGCGFMQCSQEAWAGESAAPPTWMSRLCALRASLSALSWDDSSCCFRDSSARCLHISVKIVLRDADMN